MKLSYYLITLLCITLYYNGFSQYTSQNKYDAVSAFEVLKGSEKNLKINQRTLLVIDNINASNFSSGNEYTKFLISLNHQYNCEEGNLICAKFYYIIGKRLNQMGELFHSHELLLKSEEYLKNTTLSSVDFAPDLYSSLGMVYFYFNYYTESKQLYKKALKINPKEDEVKVNTLNSLGLLYSVDNIDSSLYYYNWALKLAQKIHSKIWEPIILGNIGSIFLEEGDTATAVSYFIKDKTESLRNNQLESSFGATTMLIDIYIAQKNIPETLKYLTYCDSVASVLDIPRVYQMYHRRKSQYYELTGDYSNAFKEYKKAEKYRNLNKTINNEEAFRKREFQVNLQRSKAEKEVLKVKKKNAENILIFSCSLFIITISLILFSFRQYIKRKKRDEEILRLQNLRIDENLKNNERILRATLESLSEKNRMVDELTIEIQQSSEHSNSSEKEKLLDKLQTFRLLTDDDLIEFKRSFEKLHPGFNQYITSTFPDITNAELRMATLIKLNYSNIEMSKTLGISANSVRKTSLRLRKRLNIESQEELNAYIKKIITS